MTVPLFSTIDKLLLSFLLIAMLVLLSTCYNSYGMIAYFPSVFEGVQIPPEAQYLVIVFLVAISAIIALEIYLYTNKRMKKNGKP